MILKDRRVHKKKYVCINVNGYILKAVFVCALNVNEEIFRL